jgi:hypothetical protein
MAAIHNRNSLLYYYESSTKKTESIISRSDWVKTGGSFDAIKVEVVNYPDAYFFFAFLALFFVFVFLAAIFLFVRK